MENTTLIVLLVIVALALIVGVVVYLRTRPPQEEEPLHFNCPSCKRRLRYLPKQAGHQGACPRCRETFVFPGIAKPTSMR
jgi:hypothetical protein